MYYNINLYFVYKFWKVSEESELSLDETVCQTCQEP